MLLPSRGGFVINVAGNFPPVLKLFVADNQEINGDIERANEAIQADHLREAVGGLVFHDHDVEIAMRSSIAPGLRAEEDDAFGMCSLDQHACQVRDDLSGGGAHQDWHNSYD